MISNPSTIGKYINRKNDIRDEGSIADLVLVFFVQLVHWYPYMQKTCDVAEMAILAKKIGGKSA